MVRERRHRDSAVAEFVHTDELGFLHLVSMHSDLKSVKSLHYR